MVESVRPGPEGRTMKEIQGEIEFFRDLHQAACVRSIGSAVVLLRLRRRSAQHFGKVGLRKPDREPSCLHKLVDRPVDPAALHRLNPFVRSGKIRTIFGRDTFLNPANRFTNGLASLYAFCKSLGWTNSSPNHGYLRPSKDWTVQSFDGRKYPWFGDEFVHPRDLQKAYKDAKPLVNLFAGFKKVSRPKIVRIFPDRTNGFNR